MTETLRPDPTDPAGAGTDPESKPRPGESFLVPDDAEHDETGGSGGDEEPDEPPIPAPPD
jgi:hypothetical protein